MVVDRFGLSNLPRRRLRLMRKAARELLKVLQTCARDGRHSVRDVIPASEHFTMAEHYPHGEWKTVAPGAPGTTMHTTPHMRTLGKRTAIFTSSCTRSIWAERPDRLHSPRSPTCERADWCA